MFFERFREALVRLPAGLIRAGRAAAPHEIAAVERELGTRLPPSFVAFLESFDGADLFHETVLLAGVSAEAPRGLVELNQRRPTAEPVFAAVAGGDRFAFQADGRVVRLRADSDAGEGEGETAASAGGRSEARGAGECWLAGGDFSRWLDGLIAYHRVLYDADGEFAADAFEPDGSDVLPLVALRQTERALRACPDSAEWHHERGVALRRLERVAEAKEAFARAVALDPENPWAHFDLGRAALDLGPACAREAGAAFEAAARLEGGDAAARLWVWAARAATLEASPERVALCRREALARERTLPDQLRRARDAAGQGGDPGELAEAEALLEALESPIQPGRMRLAVVMDDPTAARAGAAPAGRRRKVSEEPAAPAPRTPPPGPRRRVPAVPPRSGGRPPARRR